MRGTPGLTRSLRYRPGLAATVLLLSAVAVGASVFGPLYQRSVGQAQVHATLSDAPVFDRGVTVSSPDLTDDPAQALDAGAVRSLFGAPLGSVEAFVEYSVAGRDVKDSLVLSREGQCSHVSMAAGRCPTSATQVMASTSAARVLGLKVGDTVHVVLPTKVVAGPTLGGDVQVVGLYGRYDPGAEFWFGHDYWTAAGAVESNDAKRSPSYTADPLIAGDGFAQRWIPSNVAAYGGVQVVNRVELPLRPDRVGLDDLSALRSLVSDVTAQANGHNARVDTNLPSLLDEVTAGQRQASTIIPGFAVELALLVLVVIAIVAGAAADQRRPDFALARLRGRSRRQTAWLMVRELAPVMLVGVLPGLAAAWLLEWLASRWWLAGIGGPELRWPVIGAAAAVVAAQLIIVAFVARRAAGQPVHDMLRRVPRQVSRRGIGALEAVLGALAAVGVVLEVSGDRYNRFAVLTPGLIALVVGLMLSRLVVAAARRLGQRALWQGKLAAGLAGVQIARRPATRRVVILLCVAAALIVSAVEQSSAAAQNRAVRAGVEAGAPVVLSVQAKDAASLQAGVTAADPSGRYATPVITQRPPNGAAVTAVDPAAFARIARWGWGKDRPPAGLMTLLNPARPAAVTVTGRTLQLQLADVAVSRTAGALNATGTSSPVSLLFGLRGSDGTTSAARLGPLPEGRGKSAVLTVSVPCATGCALQTISLLRGTADLDAVKISASIVAVRAGPGAALTPVSLGAAQDWVRATPEVSVPVYPGPANDPQSLTQTIDLRDTGGRLVLSVANVSAAALLQQLNTPIALPAILAGAVQTAPNALGYLDGNNIDGLGASFKNVGTLPLIPAAGGPSLLIDLSLAASTAAPTVASSALSVWLAADDAAREHALVTTLEQHGVTVVSRDTLSARLGALAASAPAWSMRAALVTAGLAALLAVLVMIIAGTTSQRARAYDLSALLLLGLGAAQLRRAAILEQVAAVVVAVGVGGVVGLVGAHLALPSIPIFISPTPVPAVLYPVMWASSALAMLAALLLLLACGVAVALALNRRVASERLRESQS